MAINQKQHSKRTNKNNKRNGNQEMHLFIDSMRQLALGLR